MCVGCDLHLTCAPTALGRLRHVRGDLRRIRWAAGHGCFAGGHIGDVFGLRVGSCERLLFLALDVRRVSTDDALRITLAPMLAVIEPQGLVAEALHQSERVRDEENGLVPTLELGKFVEALVREALVPDGEHLINKQHVGIDVNRNSEAEPHVHPGRIGLDGRVDEVRELGEVDDFVEALLDLSAGESQHDAVDEDVLAPGNLWMKPRAEFDECRNPAVDPNGAAGRLGDARDDLEGRALAGSVPADDTERLALQHGTRHVLEREERLGWLKIAQEAALQERALQRGEVPAAVPAVDLGDMNELDRRRHTVSANESRSRSNSQ
jgi:hypothetical protein